MATLSELRTRIARKLANDNLVNPTSSEIDTAINLAIEYYETDAFWFSEATANITLVAGDPIVPSIPTDFKQLIEPNALTVIDGQVRYPLIHATPLQYDNVDSEGRGLPYAYTYRNNQFELYFYPDQAYTLQFFYRKSYADLVNDGDSNDFTNFAERLIEYKTMVDLLYDYRENDRRAIIYENRVEREYEKIKRETYNRTATGMLTTENIIGRGRYNYYYQV